MIGACRSIDWFSGRLRYRLGLVEHIHNHQPGRDRPPFSYIIHDGSNNALVFLRFHTAATGKWFLQPGDFLVLDNASIHHIQESTGLDEYLWNFHGMFLQFLPTLSPELNPIELLWHTLVQLLRHFPLGNNFGPCSHRVAHAAQMLMNGFTHEDVDACFGKCGYI